MQNDDSGGITTSGNSSAVRIFANVVGLATIPAGSTPLGQLQFGNAGNGMLITGTNHDIRNNLILANGRHGILLRATSTTSNVVRGNYIGVSVPTGLSSLVSLGNVGDGIHIFGAPSNTIGGPQASDANVIAANGRHGVAIRSSSAWADLITRNRIYGNGRAGTGGIGIDLEHPTNGPDGLDTIANPGINYANRDQHRPAICGGAADPPLCAGVKGPVSETSGGTTLGWTLVTRPNAAANTIRVEFFATSADDSVFLGEKLVGTDAQGRPTGAGCVGGICSASVGGGTNAAGMGIVATSTDLTLDDTPPSGGANAPSNNTSEFSDAAIATPKLEITTSPPLPAGTQNQPYAGVTFAATGGTGQGYTWTVSNGAPPAGITLAANGTLAGTPTGTGTAQFTVKVTDSGTNEATKAFAITIAALPPLMITTPSPLPQGTVGTAYNLTFTASGGNGAAGNWQVQTGELPDGLALSTGGALAGTPTAVGDFAFNVQTTDQQPTTVTRAYSLKIVPAPVPLAITTASPLPNATQNTTYGGVTFAATGGSGVYETWGIVADMLPSGMTLNPTTGVLGGKPTQAGSFNVTVRVTDDAAAGADKAFALTVLPEPPPPPAGPIFSASPSEIDFGEIDVGRTAIANVVLTNLDEDSNVTPRMTSPAADSGFTVDPGTCTVALTPGQSCTMMVAFTPTEGDGTLFTGASTICRSALIGNRCLIIIGQPTTVLARLTFRGTGVGTLAQVAPTTIDFGPQLIGTQSNVGVTITNPTTGVFTFNPVLTLSNPNGFAVINGCGLGQLGAGLSCTMTFRFQPVVPGEAETASRITISGGGGTITESYDISVRGTGVNTTQPSFTTPMSLDYGMVDVGTGAAIPVVTRNASGTTLTIAAAPFAAGDQATWSRIALPCANPIANGANCTYNYTFRPRVAGDYAIDTQLDVTGTGISQVVPLSLRGTGVGTLIEASPRVLDVGDVNVGDIGRGRVTIVNTSGVTLTRTFSGASPFVFSTTCGASLVADASCSITYSLVPDGEDLPVGPVATQATLQFDGSGYSAAVTIDLGGNVVDQLFSDGYE